MRHKIKDIAGALLTLLVVFGGAIIGGLLEAIL